MAARRGIAIASTAVTMAAAAVLASSSGAETADPAKLSATRIAAPTTSVTAAMQRPRGLVLDCLTQSGGGAGLRQFSSPWNLVVGPLAMSGAGGPEPDLDSLEPFGGDKFPLRVKSGHQVTLELSRETRRGAGLTYGPRVSGGYGYRVITFVACRRGEAERAGRSAFDDGWPVSFWSGGILARSPRCVPLLIWVDDEPSPRRAVIHLGVSRCA